MTRRSTPPVIDLVTDSPVLDWLEREQRNVLMEILEILTDHPEGLEVDALRRRLRKNLRYVQKKGMKGFKRVLESFGFFKIDTRSRYRLASAQNLDRWIDETSLAVIDLEATGGRPPIHRFIELAVVHRDRKREIAEFSRLAYPDRPLPRYVTRVTGLRSRDLQDAERPEEVLSAAWPMLQDSILVFHGSGPDMEYLNYEAFRLQNRVLDNPVVCTTALARYFEPDLQTMGLDRVLAHLGVEVTVEHRALADARMTLELYEIFEERFAEAGIEKLVDLAFFQGVVNDPPYFVGNLSTDLLNQLPDTKGAYALFDSKDRLIHADFTSSIREKLQGFFYADGSIPPEARKWVRRTAYIDHLEGDGKTRPGALVRKLVRRQD